MKSIVGITGAVFVLSATIVAAEENPILGTWKLKSFVQVRATGERYNPFGEHPNGYLSYSSDGRMNAIVVGDNRVKPHEGEPTDEEAVKLYRTMLAYAGTYTLDAEKGDPSRGYLIERGDDGSYRYSPVLQAGWEHPHYHDRTLQENRRSRGADHCSVGEGQRHNPVRPVGVVKADAEKWWADHRELGISLWTITLATQYYKGVAFGSK
jgi:hypothetical protein